jgi:hypothetical protein
MANAIAKISTLRRCTFNRPSVRYNSSGAPIASGFPCYESGPFAGVYGINLWQSTINLLTSNKSHPTTTTGFTSLNGAVISIDAVNGWVGGTPNSLKVVTPGAITGEGVIIDATTVTPTTNNTGAIHIKGSAGATMSLQLTDNIDKATSINFTLTGDWQEINVTQLTDAHTTLQIRVYTVTAVQAITFYIDGNQLEQKHYATSWQLGTRNDESLSIPIAGLFNPAQGATFDAWVYVTDTAKISESSFVGRRIFDIQRTSGGGGNGITVYHDSALPLWGIAIANDSNVLLSASINDSATPSNEWYLFRARFSATQAVLTIYRKTTGALVGTAIINSPVYPLTLATNLYVASRSATAGFLNTTFANMRFSSIVRTDTPNLTIPLPVDDYTTGYFGFNNSLKCEVPIPGIKDQDVDQEIIADEFTLEGGGLGRVSFANSPRRIWNFSSIRTPKLQFDSLAETLRLEGQGSVDFWSDEFGADTNTIKAYVNLLKRKRSPAGLEGNWRDDLQILNVQVKEKTPL